MERFSKKILAGEVNSPEDWVEYLKQAHHEAPGMTPHAFDDFKASNGQNSYQVLAKTLGKLSSKQVRILDLACGDGHLIPFIQKMAEEPAQILGVDMSADELEIAKTKKFGSNVIFKCEMANSISESSNSFDAILCHMALMLMTPIEPVVLELYRLLRPNGLIASVVGSSPSELSFNMTYRKILNGFIKEKYPKFIAPVTGDQRINTQKDLQSVFPESKFYDLKAENICLFKDIQPMESWNYFKDMYLVTILPDKEKAELRSRIVAAAEDAKNSSNLLTLEFPISLISCRKKLD